MYIKEIILDGFKSYSTRTSVPNFDPQFNAITGLNGSGKSNILDAICFVMGISTLKHIRVEKKQELIYKGGTAGVQKASVTLVFDNSNKSQSPQTYEEYDTLSINQTIQDTTSKYFINGRKATVEQIKNLFCSVRLNVNNPHFLIMQGRVTKVINMKPVEVLSLIEEAAGTSHYQTKRENALAILKKKETKLMEIDDIVKQDITPKLEQLDKEKKMLDEYKGNQSELEKLNRVEIARQFSLQSEKLENQNALKDYYNEEKKLSLRIQQNKNSIKEIEIVLKDLQKKNLSDDSNLKKKELEISENEKILLQLSEELKYLIKDRDELSNEKEKIEKKQAQLQKDQEKIKQQTIALKKDLEEQIQVQQEQKVDQLHRAEDELKDLQSGKRKNNDAQNDQFIINLIKECDNNIDTAINKQKQANLDIQKTQKNLETAQKYFNEHKSQSTDFQKRKEELQKQISDKNKQIESQEYQRAENQAKEIAEEVQKKQIQVENFQREIQQKGMIRSMLEFQYQFPSNYPGLNDFQPNLIYGRILRLFKVKECEKYGLAIQTILGGRMRNVVIENHIIGRDLLQYNAIRSHETFIPQNKIKFKIIDENRVKDLKKLTGNQIELAINLLEFDKKYEPAIAFIFGSTFVANDQQSARRISQEQNEKYNCVTLQGDNYRQDGVLSGGRVEQNLYISQIEEYLKFEKNYKEAMAQHDLAIQKQQRIENLVQQKKRLKDEISIIEKQLENHLQRSNQEKVEELQGKIQEFQEKIQEFNLKIKEAQKEEQKFKKEKAQNQKQQEEMQNKKSPDAVENFLKQTIQKISQEVKSLKQEIDQANDKISKNEVQIESIDEQLKKNQQKQSQDQSRFAQILSEVSDKQKSVDQQQEFLDSQKADLENFQRQHSQLDSNLREKQNQQEDFRKAIERDEEQRKQTQNNIQKFEEDLKNAQAAMNEMMQEHKWISQDRIHFGQPDHFYDFNKISISEAQKRIKELTKLIEDSKKRVNFKVDTMYDDQNERYEKLLNKRKTIFENKIQVEETIKFLNIKKNEELEKTWKVVSDQCGQIFSTLLPGTQAKLSLASEQEGVEKGLILKVAFNNSWKESLSELSGGQRSLLALSLILALLKYQPAPLYILDEIDSALDLSHTQNIGIMIKKFFTNSQFIVVSLKEGLFQNANVLFKVSFNENRSQVKRYEIKDNQSGQQNQINQQNQNNLPRNGNQNRRGRQQNRQEEVEEEKEEEDY